ncbi:NUDIX hydrolase [Nonomuraea sp. PA05]|uniref:NUDIX domain-containing protein n=1 Tax=Nonomuraea sp. PA05 TaxID=2604466 RepID=UPI0011D446CF|nr:NUDIX hydrolase [Nonomuraea sp. PA05]TYB58922.1 NUDIX hydrolase [Nonomuraea sp. PA05]
MSQTFLPPAEWYATLPTVHLSACMLLTDEADRVLLVKPNYRPYWGVPGGIVDDGEPPHVCAVREIGEELGLEIPSGPLLVVDWMPPMDERRRPMMNFIFDGGTIADPSRIRLQTEELDAAEFWEWEEAATKLSATTAARIPAARAARESRQTIFLPAERDA